MENGKGESQTMKLGIFPFLLYLGLGGEHKKCPSIRDKKKFYEGTVLEAFFSLIANFVATSFKSINK